MKNIKLAQTILGSNAHTAAAQNEHRVVPVSTLVVFDDRVTDLDLLNQALLPGSIGFTIRANADGLETITQLLAATGAKYLAIVAHGEPGVVHLGKTTLKIEQLQAQAQLLSEWDVESIALYSCEVAQGDLGRDFIYQLSELTGATVAAAATKTGCAALGGSWDLTVTTGKITAPMLFAAEILNTYRAVLGLNLGPAISYSVGPGPISVAIGINSDGTSKIVTANSKDDTVSILVSNPIGGFYPYSGYVVGKFPFAVATGDFNGDGNADIVSANLSDNTVTIIVNGDRGNYAVGFAPDALAIGDLNGDGKLDIVTSNLSDNTISVLVSNTFGGFNTSATPYNVGKTPQGVAIGDINRDGKLDIVVANSGSTANSVSVLIGDGSGRFPFGSDSYPVGRTPTGIALGDLNGDGRPDIVTANSGDTNISILLSDNTTTSGFYSPLTINVGKNPSSVAIGDIDGDGKLDVVTANSGDNTITLLRGNGFGSFNIPYNYTVGLNPYSVAIGDINGDGRPDIVTANSGDNTVTVLSNKSVVNNPRNDFNGDGKSDILWRNNDGSVALWQLNGSTATPKSIGALPAGWTTAGTGDFNGDGKTDILLRNTATGSVANWRMNGEAVIKATTIGTLTAGWSIAGTAYLYGDPRDINGDGTADILLTNTNGTVAEWRMNNSTVTEAKTIGTLSAGWSVAGTGDFNGDLKTDILLKNTNGTIAEWQMDGSTVLAGLVIGAVTPDWSIAGVADFNGDGKADLLFRNTNGNVAEWQIDGSTVTSTKIIGSSTPDWKISGTGDYNGDGKADILWRNDGGGVATWQLDGNNILAAGATSIPSAATSWNIAAPIL
jgi:hypothetical protein